MTQTETIAVQRASAAVPDASGGVRHVVIALIAFFTVVDLFATQAILPTLAAAYDVSPAAMGVAVNASTIGMAAAGLAVSLFSDRLDRKWGVVASLLVLAVPTALLASAPDLGTFSALRIVQGLCMATAFTLTISYLAENTCGTATASALAAYITGNVASNLFGRLLSASTADHFGLATNFYVFAALNIAGAALAYVSLTGMTAMAAPAASMDSRLAAWKRLLRNPALLATLAIGFSILFAFIGTFTYVNFVLVRPPLSLAMMSLGLAYFVFLPAIVTTPLAGRLVRYAGPRLALVAGLAIAGAGLPLLLEPYLPLVLSGMVLVGAGTFLAQAVATGTLSWVAGGDPGAASGLYLASYFLGGLAGSAVLGQVFERFGWTACVAGIGLAIAIGAGLAWRFLPEKP